MGSRLVTVLAALAIFCVPAVAQSTAQRDPQAVLLLQKSLAGLTVGSPIHDITLTGNVRRLAGSLDESGSVTLEGTAAGQSRIEVTLPSGERLQVRDVSAAPWTGSWSHNNGTWHHIADQNLATDPTWFFPAFLINKVLSNAGYVISPAKAQTVDGASVECIAVEQEYSGSQQLPSLLRKLSKADICLDSQSLLPVGIGFNIHPDNDALTNIPARVLFSDYRNVQGDTVPYRIRKYIQNGLAMDVTLTDVQLNASLSNSDFEAQ